MNADEWNKLGWRGKLRTSLLRVTRDPILSARVDGMELRLSQTERMLAHFARRGNSVRIDLEAPEVKIGDVGRAQLLEQKLEALQARVDALTLSLSECRAECAEAARHLRPPS